MAGKRKHHRAHGADGDDLVEPKKITGKELSEAEELSAINKNEYRRMVAMRLHEISKAGAIEELDEEL
jgi:hypothetical protein